VDSHEKGPGREGIAEETIVSAVRIASVLHTVAAVLDVEAALVRGEAVAA
jgi:hypothetical protein